MYTERDSIGRMKLLLEAWYGDLDKGGKRRGEKTERKKINGGKKETPMTVNWWVSGSMRTSHRGSASGSQSRLTDGAFN